MSLAPEDMGGDGLVAADELKDIRNRFRDGLTSILYLKPSSGLEIFSASEMCAIRKWFSYQRLTNPHLQRTASTFDSRERYINEGRSLKFRDILSLDCETGKLNASASEIREKLNLTPWIYLREATNQVGLVLVFTWQDEQHPRFGVFDPAIVEELRRSFQKELQPLIGGAKVSWVGSADFQWHVHQALDFSKYINLAMMIFLLLALRYVYGNWLSGTIFIATLVVTFVWLLGLQAFFGSSMDVMSSGLILMISIASLEDFAFVSSEQMRTNRWKKAVRMMLIPAFFTSLTTIIGFLSLGTSDLAMIRRFGVWSAVGAFIEWIQLFVVVPAILPLFTKKLVWVNPKANPLHDRLRNLGTKPIPKGATWMALLVFPIALFLFPKINLNESAYSLFPSTHEFNLGIDELKSSKGWIGSVSLLGDRNISMKDLDDIGNQLLQDPFGASILGGFESGEKIINWLNQESLMSRDQDESDYRTSPIYRDLSDNEDVPRLLFYLRDVSTDSIQRLRELSENICKGRCHLGGDLVAFTEFSKRIPKTLISSMGLSLLLVSLVLGFLAFAFKKQVLIWKLLVTSFWGPFVMLILVAVSQTPLDTLKCIFAGVLVGLTGDNAIQFLFASRREQIHGGIRRRADASIITLVLMAVVSLFYLGSKFYSPRIYGLILFTGFLVTLVGDLWLLNGLLDEEKKS